MTAPTAPCATCGTACNSAKTPPECADCRRRAQAGEHWSPDVLTDGEWRPTGAGGTLQWHPWPKPRAKVAKCGTDGGYYRHLRRTKTEPCAACRRAHALAQAKRKERATLRVVA
ncbi:hypothetical protein FHU40_000796 [Nocardioides soli]|uniref:Uncharacterized protein n=1 Tax=Nocardioides soli TaxID=1036020 RepID=A0A7W4VSS7_9ACTN|nr:hypothetical protein [Nocardioides soli]